MPATLRASTITLRLSRTRDRHHRAADGSLLSASRFTLFNHYQGEPSCHCLKSSKPATSAPPSGSPMRPLHRSISTPLSSALPPTKSSSKRSPMSSPKTATSRSSSAHRKRSRLPRRSASASLQFPKWQKHPQSVPLLLPYRHRTHPQLLPV